MGFLRGVNRIQSFENLYEGFDLADTKTSALIANAISILLFAKFLGKIFFVNKYFFTLSYCFEFFGPNQ